jgi:hypothetical protein
LDAADARKKIEDANPLLRQSRRNCDELAAMMAKLMQ